MLEALRSHLDYAIFVGVALLLMAAVHLLFWRGLARRLIPTLAWLTMLCLLGLGWWVVDQAGRKEQARMRQMVEGFPPTYAQELQRMGHEKITSETAPDDPLYLSLIEAQKRWLKVNPSINDVYTFRRKGDGTIVLMVDSETDYDRDGRFDGEREVRTEIGEAYESPYPALIEAFETGKATFTPDPVTDRWGTWMSALAPLLNSAGKLDAVLGVDFDAREWSAATRRARWNTMSYLGMLLVAIMGISTTGIVSLLREDGRQRLQTAELEQQSRIKFESLVNSIQGIVWEWDPALFQFTYVSRQAEEILGLPCQQWQDIGFWESRLHPDDKDWAQRKCAEHAKQGEPYQYEYRMVAADGRVVWIRESGSLIHSQSGAPLVRGVLTDITREKQAAEEMESMHKQLVETSRQAGMAEIASGVLHNVGNVLNSVNVSSTLIQDQLSRSRLPNLGKLATMLREQGDNLAQFIATDERGKKVPQYLEQLTSHLTAEHKGLLAEIRGLTRNLEHIKDIVVMQQAYAKVSGRTEAVDLCQLVDDALHINASSFTRHRIKIVRKFQEVPSVLIDRHKVLQILINLIRNAKHALEEAEREDRAIAVSVGYVDAGNLGVAVADNGIGILEENLTRIFNHGFTTKKSGHGFGLHISALAAKEMGGNLQAQSKGVGRGATFILQLPLRKAESPQGTFTPSPSRNTAPIKISTSSQINHATAA